MFDSCKTRQQKQKAHKGADDQPLVQSVSCDPCDTRYTGADSGFGFGIGFETEERRYVSNLVNAIVDCIFTCTGANNDG